MSGLIEWIKRAAREKREYRQMEKRAKALPKEYAYVFRKIQHYMWNYSGGDGTDMTRMFTDLLDLFESGAAEGKRVLEITGEDVAGFCDDLLRNARTYTQDWRENLNRDIRKKLGRRKGA